MNYTTNVTYTSCCIHVTSVSLDTTENSFIFTLSNGNTIKTDPLSLDVVTDIYTNDVSLAGTLLTLTNTTGATLSVDLNSLQNVYTSGTGIDITSNVISLSDMTETESFVSLINNPSTHTLKTITSSDNSVIITDNTTHLDLSSNNVIEINIITDNATTKLDPVTTYYKNAIGLVGNIVVLPSVTTVPFGVEYHIFAGSDVIISATGTGNELISTISTPHDYTSANFVNSHLMIANEYYIIRKYSSSAFIITKQ